MAEPKKLRLAIAMGDPGGAMGDEWPPHPPADRPRRAQGLLHHRVGRGESAALSGAADGARPAVRARIRSRRDHAVAATVPRPLLG